MLLALAMAAGTATQKALLASGVTTEKLNTAINAMRGGRKAESANAEQGY